MCQELMEIFQGSPRCAPPGPTDCSTSIRDALQPPSRNQNPLVKDQVRVLKDEICSGLETIIRGGQQGAAQADFQHFDGVQRFFAGLSQSEDAAPASAWSVECAGSGRSSETLPRMERGHNV